MINATAPLQQSLSESATEEVRRHRHFSGLKTWLGLPDE
jgi:hypothetical protein